MGMNVPQKVCAGFFLFLFIFWCLLFFSGTTEGFYNYLFSFLFGLTPLIGGFAAIESARVWGGLKSAVGRAVFFIGFGIFLWGGGETIWSYYNFFLGVPAPYPSLADVGFAPSIFFYGLGAIYLARATGARYVLRDHWYAKGFAIIAPLIIAVLSYYMLVILARGGVLIPQDEGLLKTILDIAYPVGDFVGLAIAVVVGGLSFKYLGGRYQMDIYAILLGLGVMFVADTIFSYTTTVGTYYNADFGDLVLALGTSLLAFGVLGFYRPKGSE